MSADDERRRRAPTTSADDERPRGRRVRRLAAARGRTRLRAPTWAQMSADDERRDERRRRAPTTSADDERRRRTPTWVQGAEIGSGARSDAITSAHVGADERRRRAPTTSAH